MPNFWIPQSALSALDVSMGATANNIANINTDGYKSLSVTLQSGPRDQGVRVGGIYRDMSPGPAVISHLSENDLRDGVDSVARGMRNQADNYNSAVSQDIDRMWKADAADAWQVENRREGDYIKSVIDGLRLTELSNVDLPRQFANLIVTENAYSANAAVIRSWEELTGSLLNIKV